MLEGVGRAARGDVLVAAVGGGLLAPLTPRYAVRDLLREIGAPVVVVARSAPDVASLLRLTLESARGAGLHVSAVVLVERSAGAPGEPPSPGGGPLPATGPPAGRRDPTLPATGPADPTVPATGPPDPTVPSATGPPAGPPDAPAMPRPLDPGAPDEHALLAELLPVPLHVLPGTARTREALEEVAASWDVEAWLEPGPAGEDSPAGPAAEVALEPYDAWTERPVGDPRATPRPAIMAALEEIVAAEGPMTATRAFALYNRASGGRKLTAVARGPLSSALGWLAQERRIAMTRADDIPWQGDDVVRALDAPAVRVRALGPRALEEVPLDEVAELVRRVRSARGLREPTALKRAVLGAYGLVRLTTRADEYLTLAVDLAEP